MLEARELHQNIIEQIKDHESLKKIRLTTVSQMIKNKNINLEDEASRSVIQDDKGKKVALLACSNRLYPDYMLKTTELTLAVREKLTVNVANIVIEPLFNGSYDGLSFVLWPWCRSFGDQLYQKLILRIMIRPNILVWLRHVMMITKVSMGQEEREQIIHYLYYVMENEDFAPALREWAREAHQGLRDKSWNPFYCLSHGDLWPGNIMFPNTGFISAIKRNQFIIIDWAGANLKGVPYSDLIYFCMTSSTSGTTFRKTMRKYSRFLDDNFNNYKFYLVVSLGFLGLNLNQFPYERLIELSNLLYNYLNENMCVL